MSRYDWMEDARCAQVDPELWHPEGVGAGYGDAKRVCARCPVQRQCADFAQAVEGDTSYSGRHGLWAGQSPKKRAAGTEGTGRNLRAAERRQQVLRLVTRGGMDAYEIAEHVGVDVRTVWRVTKAHRDQLGEAA
ncbi:WhiB family transcriptional regulator [Streptomyces sp. NBC_01373]|uniref:WhiB family transcriptional regulator n=1 Tax=Streptomyces sp. NBC_01373 TaxID=2903843 RepID=UPI0022541639|nr:WhiB family transcriptional regulator [Streptomyces sp. NBC_01373]MCX4697043.1 WhiB family transcriptional regulator [Streptomyces sp. NBC_01373]MCX4707032.1 WhiB family transcriptional regulator [Streptomyces sp. NBC_01373]